VDVLEGEVRHHQAVWAGREHVWLADERPVEVERLEALGELALDATVE